MLSDNGPQYANQVIDELSRLVTMSLEKTIAYSHEENGLVERANKEILRHLRALLLNKAYKDSWSTIAPLVQRIINATRHSATGMAPAEIIMPGLKPNAGILFDHESVVDANNTMADYLHALVSSQADIVRNVQAALGARFAKNQKQFDAKHKTSFYPKGSYVLLQYPIGTRAPTKLQTPWMGPYRVLSHTGANYELENLLTGKPLNRHISLLKDFDATRCAPSSLVTDNTDYYIIESIMSHTGRTNKKAQMRFRVRWLGYGPSDDTHEPWKHLQNNPWFHKYCREQDLPSLIPSSFKDFELPPVTFN
jgi:uncharacterized protein YukE